MTRKSPKLETHNWEIYEKQAEVVGRGKGRALAEKYIAALEARWGGPPDSPEAIEVACKWIEESALAEAATLKWNSGGLASYRYARNTTEWRAFDARLWRIFQRNVVRAIRAALTKYGCGNLRWLDMDSFLRYYEGRKK